MVVNCCIVNCTTYQDKQIYPLLSFHKIPPSSTKNERKKEWRAQLLRKVNRCDRSFNAERAYICSRHFDQHCFKIGKTGRKDLLVGSLPTLFLPKKSHQQDAGKQRRKLERLSQEVPLPVLYKYRDFADFKKGIGKIKQPWVILHSSDETVALGLADETGNIQIKVSVDESLGFDIESNIQQAPDNHFIFKKYKRTVSKTQINVILKDIASLNQCQGITEPNAKEFGIRHVLSSGSKIYNFSTYKVGQELRSSLYSRKCSMLLNGSFSCSECKLSTRLLRAKLRMNEKQKGIPIAKKAPLTKIAKDRLVRAVHILKVKERNLEDRLKVLENELEAKGVNLDNEMHDNLSSIIERGATSLPENSFENLFWKEQKRAFESSKTGYKWHPMMIRFALHLHLKSPAAYRSLKESLVIRLPSERTLRDYSNVFQPSVGFKKEVLEDLKHQGSQLKGIAKYVVLMLDELSVQDDLVFNNSTNELVGFVNLGEDLNQIFKKKATDSIASHALVFMVCGIASKLKFSLGYFATTTATAAMLYPLVWRAVGYCEGFAGLKVIGVVSDKASGNQKLYRILCPEQDVSYKTVNVFCGEERPLFLFSDPPHLIKTVRNNLASSGFDKKRLLWNGKEMTWSHISSLFESDRQSEVRKLHKLRHEHIYLTSYSKMRVNLAAQVMSETVGKVMHEYGSPDSSETAKMILMMDKFFDCCNTRSLSEGDRKRKPFLKPYTDINDSRFSFMKDEFLKFLNDWKEAIESRDGNYSEAERKKMFLSKATYDGLQTTSYALIECVKYLLQNGFKYVLTNRFCQDPLENHFGMHRGLGRRSCNPTVYALGYQENKLRLQRTIASSITPQGNTKGSKGPKQGITITTSPLKKRKRQPKGTS